MLGRVDLGSGERDVHDDHLSSPYVPGGTPVHREPLTCSAAVLTVSDRNPAGGKAARRTPVAQCRHRYGNRKEGTLHAATSLPGRSTAAPGPDSQWQTRFDGVRPLVH